MPISSPFLIPIDTFDSFRSLVKRIICHLWPEMRQTLVRKVASAAIERVGRRFCARPERMRERFCTRHKRLPPMVGNGM